MTSCRKREESVTQFAENLVCITAAVALLVIAGTDGNNDYKGATITSAAIHSGSAILLPNHAATAPHYTGPAANPRRNGLRPASSVLLLRRAVCTQ
ncbi:hypothetical protein RR46_02367 [Papilio xuthus]|uniref:Uncharacterized protein n=1 Tax=Papilio xuthus TaxID=66420 RepID=A0A194Q6Y2_PAPXU|nr:hypothetical protein RR46_02367 [Papilio xuthus]